MTKIKSQTENPKGLHQMYYITKIVKNPDFGVKITDEFMGKDSTPEFTLQPVDENAEYFVLRLDENGSDPKHIAACREAILTYATVIRNHLPELSDDLFERYGKKQPPIKQK